MWPFKTKSKKHPVLQFACGQDFFEYQCKYGITNLERENGLVAIVESATLKPDCAAPVKANDVGIQIVSLKVVSNDGGFKVISETSAIGPMLVADDLVIWVPFENLGMFDHIDPRSSWIGLTVAKLACQIDMNVEGFTIDHYYR
jgi:hypothetical protein